MRFLTSTILGLSIVSLLTATPVLATPHQDATARVLDGYVRGAVTDFAAQTTALAEAAVADCTSSEVIDGYHASFDAWLRVQPMHLAIFDAGGHAVAISFWPDKKGMIPRALTNIIADKDPVVSDPVAFTEVSIAARGFFALEFMLYDDKFAGFTGDSYACALVQAQSKDLARMADDIVQAWTRDGGYASLIRSAGDEGNTMFFNEKEPVQALFTVLTATLEHNRDYRLSRPMGSFAKPRPARAEARRSARSARNVMLSLAAARDLAAAMSPTGAPLTGAVLDQAIGYTEALDDPSFAGTEDLSHRLKLEIIQERIDVAIGHIANEIGAPLGVSAGFNAGDGD